MQISEPHIIATSSLELVGIAQEMSLLSMPIAELWKTFRSHEAVRKQFIPLFYSVQLHHAPLDVQHFAPAALFTKWACASRDFFETMPTEFLSLHIPAGLYAQFEVTAPPTAAKEVFEFIYGEWLPTSGYQLAHRHQLEVIPHDYMQQGDRAQETIWIPIERVNKP
jgi:AraC family transcriptional regulator